MAITAAPTMACNNDNCNFRYLGTIISPPILLYWKFFLQVLAMLQITLLVVLCTIWHEKVNGSCFHTKVNHNFIFKDFKVEFPVEPLLHSLGNIDFWNLLSFLILKHYLSIKFGWRKFLQEIVLL